MHSRLEDNLTLYDLGFLGQAGIRIDLEEYGQPPPDANGGPENDVPTDEEITEAIIREMDITHMPREEVLRTVREFFKRDHSPR